MTVRSKIELLQIRKEGSIVEFTAKLRNAYREGGVLAVSKRALRKGCIYIDTCWFRYSHFPPGMPPQIEMRIVALRRSGHHAIINWIRHQIGGGVLFLNNCRPGHNPYASCVRNLSDSCGFIFNRRRMNCTNDSRMTALIYNYEDCKLADIVTEEFERNRLRWLGKSGRRVDILVLRDPLNLLASMLMWSRGRVLQPDRDALRLSRDLWKVYAREALGDTEWFPEKIVVDYNRWFSSDSYRDRLRKELRLNGDDRGMWTVARYGPVTWGDSFDGTEYDGRTREMKVHERWKAFEHDEEYLELIKDDELLALYSRLYGGAIEGSERLLRRLL